jgi:hypothetical protein
MRKPVKPRKPIKPQEPSETIEVLYTAWVPEEVVTLGDFKRAAEELDAHVEDVYLSIEHKYGYGSCGCGPDDSCSFDTNFCVKKLETNPSYGYELEKYKKKMVTHKKRLKEYEEKLAKYEKASVPYTKYLIEKEEENKKKEIRKLKKRLKELDVTA